MSNSDSFQESKAEIKNEISHSSTFSGLLPNEFTEEKKDWKNDNKCKICNKKFGLGKRHHCRYCGSSVCEKHSIKKKNLDSSEKIWICDNCDLNLIKEEIRAEIQEELAKLQDNIDIAKESYEKVEAERLEKTKIVSLLEEELTNTERIQKKKEEELMEKLKEEMNKLEKASENVDNIRRELDESHVNEKEMSEKSRINEDKIEEMRKEIIQLKEKKKDLITQLEHLANKLKGSLPLDQVVKSLCEKCAGKIQNDFKRGLESDDKEDVTNQSVGSDMK